MPTYTFPSSPVSTLLAFFAVGRQYYWFVALLFDVSSAPGVFTKMLPPQCVCRGISIEQNLQRFRWIPNFQKLTFELAHHFGPSPESGSKTLKFCSCRQVLGPLLPVRALRSRGHPSICLCIRVFGLMVVSFKAVSHTHTQVVWKWLTSATKKAKGFALFKGK